MFFLKIIRKEINHLLNINVWLINGNEIHSKKPITILYAGNEIQKNYISKITFDAINDDFFVGKYSLLSLYFLIQKPKYKQALIFIEGHSLHRFLKKKKDFFIPLWLTSTVSIPLLPQNNSTKDDFRIINKNKLSHHIATSIEEYHFFYYSMYLPTVEKRHQNSKIVMQYQKMLDEIYNYGGKLLLVKQEKKLIAGVVIVTREKTPRIWSNGILEGNISYWKTGAIAATYYFSSQYLFQKGHTEMNLGLSRSFLNDGILQYKKKWGAHFMNHGRRGFITKINIYSDGIKSFLENNPFAYQEKNDFCGAFFTDKTVEKVEKLNHSKAIYNLKSFKKCNIFEIQNDNSIIKTEK